MLDILLPDPKILTRRPGALIIIEEERRANESDALTASLLAVERRQETTRSPFKRKIVRNEKDRR